jgi:hypothetical protein
LASKGESPE